MNYYIASLYLITFHAVRLSTGTDIDETRKWWHREKFEWILWLRKNSIENMAFGLDEGVGCNGNGKELRNVK